MTGFSPRAVVFDFDGTLLDSLPFVLRAFTHALEPFGARPTMELFATLGGPPAQAFGRLLADPHQVESALERLADYNAAHEREVGAFAGAAELLEGLGARGVAVALWTARDRSSTRRLLEREGWVRHLSALVCGDDLPSHKPDPAGLQKILRELGVEPAEALMVGDADVDLSGAAGAGVRSLFISHGRPWAAGPWSAPWRQVVHPAEAFAVLHGLAGPRG